MTQWKALIFDQDGVIADTERDGHRVAFNRVFAEEDLEESDEEEATEPEDKGKDKKLKKALERMRRRTR